MTTEDLKQANSRYFLEGKIDRFKDKMALIVTKDGQKILWPIKDLPQDCEKGTKVRVILSTSKTDQQEREETAKTILNEVLKINDQDAGSK